MRRLTDRDRARREFVRRVFAHGSAHGSELQDLLVEATVPASDAEQTLAELVEGEILLRGATHEATHSQGAFIALQYGRRHPGWVAGCRAHFRFTPWPRTVGELRRAGYPEAADALAAKLGGG